MSYLAIVLLLVVGSLAALYLALIVSILISLVVDWLFMPPVPKGERGMTDYPVWAVHDHTAEH